MSPTLDAHWSVSSRKGPRPPHHVRVLAAERSRTIQNFLTSKQDQPSPVETPTGPKMLGQLVSGLFQALPRSIGALPVRQLGTLFNTAPTAGNAVAGGSWSLMPARTAMRYHFPIARETKRIKVHGWKKRMSTPEGRRIIMRRILKGCHVLSH